MDLPLFINSVNNSSKTIKLMKKIFLRHTSISPILRSSGDKII